jgi:hypothetical protein
MPSSRETPTQPKPPEQWSDLQLRLKVSNFATRALLNHKKDLEHCGLTEADYAKDQDETDRLQAELDRREVPLYDESSMSAQAKVFETKWPKPLAS